MNEHEFHVACAILEDNRKLISAGKAQRWDVIKWAITINVALATASIALKDRPNAAAMFFWISVLVAVIAWELVWHYNSRMKNVRNDAVVTEKYLGENGVDYREITGRLSKSVSLLYDWQELIFFTVILLGSLAPAGVVWKVFATMKPIL